MRPIAALRVAVSRGGGGLVLLPVAVVMVLAAVGPEPRAQAADAASERGFGRLSAVSALPGDEQWRPPADITIETRDTDLDGVEGPHVDAVRDALRQSLRERGIAVGPDASHVLHFMVTMAPSPAPPDEPTTMDEPYLPPTASYRSLDVVDQVTVPLGERDAGGVSSHVSISLMLFVPGEAPLWHGTITASGEVEEPIELLRRMTRAAMKTLGRSEQRTFALSCTDADARDAAGSAVHCLP